MESTQNHNDVAQNQATVTIKMNDGDMIDEMEQQNDGIVDEMEQNYSECVDDVPKSFETVNIKEEPHNEMSEPVGPTALANIQNSSYNFNRKYNYSVSFRPSFCR